MIEITRPLRLSRRLMLGGLVAGMVAGLAVPMQARAQDDKGDAPAKAESIEITARPITHFERGRPDVKRFGELEFRGGLVLTSPSSHFGGWSDLIMEADGNSLFAISDVGGWFSADIKYEGTRPVGLANARLGPILAVTGRPLADKREQDAESLTLVEGNLTRGSVLIGFERLHRIGRFEIRDRELQVPSGYMKMPADARRMSANQGLEGLAVLRAGPLKGSVVGFAERLTRGSGYHTGWIWTNGEPKSFQLRDIDGFDLTGAAGLHDGGLLVLERRFRWMEGVKMRIRHLAVGRDQARRAPRGPHADPGRLRFRDRQHGRHRRAPQQQRRDHHHVDVRRQLQFAAAAQPAAAVHAARQEGRERVPALTTRWVISGLDPGYLASRNSGMTSSRSGRDFAAGLDDVAAQALAALGELRFAGLEQEGVEAAPVLHGLQGVGADAQAKLALQRVADQRHLAQVGAEGALGLVLGVAAQLAGHRQLACQLTSAGHEIAP